LLSLTSPRWSKLRHAYGNAEDIPPLLAQLKNLPDSADNKEPWFSLWSALAHQGDVYSASFAAVPYVVAALASNPTQASYDYFQFPAWVEICRQKNSITVPKPLATDYFSSLARLPHLAAAASERDWDADFLQVVLAAIAAAKGSGKVAEAANELSPEVAEEFMKWFFER
jgi:hypothetical protein